MNIFSKKWKQTKSRDEKCFIGAYLPEKYMTTLRLEAIARKITISKLIKDAILNYAKTTQYTEKSMMEIIMGDCISEWDIHKRKGETIDEFIVYTYLVMQKKKIPTYYIDKVVENLRKYENGKNKNKSCK